MNKYICIHGHFYQPPRENPWLEEVEIQDSAYPYHDWNQRINAECYAPNSTARMLDNKGMIVDIVNNYAKMSFNFGPSLLSWMKTNEPRTYDEILKSDAISMKNFSGHGSALAQCYNHIIMPLANSRDKRTQIAWGIKDFESRFKRRPEGMWLPETAVDLESLDIMSDLGIKFTILAPHQASKTRKIGENKWEDVLGSRINPKTPYLCSLPSGGSIVIFFYDGPTSRDVAFGDLLGSGINFANRLQWLFSIDDSDELVNIATDGETYGHHHHMGDMALSYCMDYIEKNRNVKFTNYAEYLDKFSPENEVEIIENTSWSCMHGVERWRGDCGCNSGGNPSWNQQWRKPLREAMDWLRDTLVNSYQKNAKKYLKDEWAARDDYIEIILDRSKGNVEEFFKKHASKKLNKDELTKALRLLESQRHSLLMYTSCGWFFDELSGIETMQILQYAARAIQLSDDITPENTEKTFIELLEKAPSNLSKYGNGAYAYIKTIKPSVLDLARVGVHYAVSSLFEHYKEIIDVYCFVAQSLAHDSFEIGKQKLVIGRVLIKSKITLEEATISYAVLHLGGHNLVAGVRNFINEKEYNKMSQEIASVFKGEDSLGTIKLIEKSFASRKYSLKHLFKDEQSKILYLILDDTLEKIDSSLQQVREYHYPIMQLVKALQIPLPKVLSNTVLVMLNADLIKVLVAERVDFYRLERLVEEIKEWDMEIDMTAIEFIVRTKIYNLMNAFLDDYNNIQFLNDASMLLKAIAPLMLDINLWKAQNIFFLTGKRTYPEQKLKASKGDNYSKEWVAAFDNLGVHLKVKVH